MAAVVAYRNLLRAARVAFQGDTPMLLAAQSQIRGGFRDKQALDPKDGSVGERIEHATQVAKFLRENVVQGKKMDGQDAMYKLRIHEHTERGDNESIKTAGSGIAGGGCCGGVSK
ncbi:hypothetical protein IF1G_01246 [Cordyceps javanica]|uniref:Mitochondrial zinc maintenance protein 1, mitochondrial n=1 Tax=Cordyceps javanica TaxID=43265 RepID=A0A545VHW4_9HYPO|nr:hypothetical protein IF1G_01246 [Cordyceps javanica]TQW12468.1 complex 1 protein (LYR family) domain-containing protein [Cordyceps javanica]